MRDDDLVCEIVAMIRRCGVNTPLTSRVISSSLGISPEEVDSLLEDEASSGMVARINHHTHDIWEMVAHIPAWRDRQSRKSCTDYAKFA